VATPSTRESFFPGMLRELNMFDLQGSRLHLAASLLAMTFLAVATVAWAGEEEIRVPKAARTVPDSYIVVLEDAVYGDAKIKGLKVSQIADEMAGRHGGRVSHVYEHGLLGFATKMSKARAKALARDPRVKYVEQDSLVWAVETQINPPWGVDRIDQRDRPLDASYIYNFTGARVNAYIIDTGIRKTHADFEGRAFHDGFTAISDGQGSSDCNGHGTHVAATVGGATHGVAKQVALIAVRVLDCQGSGTISDVIAGVNWVTANRVLPAVANMSLGGGASSSLDTAIRNSIAAGVTYVVAAGNSNVDACSSSPSRVLEALTVGSSTSSDTRSSFSNWGPCLDLFAPGSSITSAWSTSDTATATISGTSMASPHVAGVAALYLEQHPDASPATVAAAIVDNATTGRLTGIGTGSPNRLVDSLLPTGDRPPTASFTYSCIGLACSFDGSGSSDDFGIVQYDWSFGDDGFGSGMKTDHTYAVAGSYTVTLTVKDAAGQTESQSKSVTVGAPCTACERYTGFLSRTGASSYQPNGRYYFFSGSGTHQGWLRGPAGTDFDLYLQKWNGFSWSTVARSVGPASEEQITYNGTSGYYRWRIYSYFGSGSYDFWLIRP
jgi:serine protease